MVKTTDPSVFDTIETPTDSLGFDPKSILQRGFCLKEGEDVALFEDKGSGVYFGHYFLQSRGKKAIEVSMSFLSEAFETANVIAGLTPIENKAALWMTRRLGFSMMDVVDTTVGKMQLSMLTKKDFMNE